MSSYTYESIPFYETYESYTLGLMSIRNDSVFFTGGFLYDNELILDFGMEEGDSLELNDPSVSGALNLVVDSIQMIEIDGVEYKHSFGKKTCTMNSYYEEDFQMIEGIGNVRDFFLWNTDGCVIGGGVN